MAWNFVWPMEPFSFESCMISCHIYEHSWEASQCKNGNRADPFVAAAAFCSKQEVKELTCWASSLARVSIPSSWAVNFIKQPRPRAQSMGSSSKTAPPGYQTSSTSISYNSQEILWCKFMTPGLVMKIKKN